MRVEEEKKKEIWIDKLIELFKDYVENYWNDTKDPTIDYAVIYDWQWFYVGAKFYSDEKVLSKKFWFMQRLVEHDKIDQFYYESTVRVKRYIDEYEEYDYVFPMDYEQLIMLLSIKDKPIEWLCEILK